MAEACAAFLSAAPVSAQNAFAQPAASAGPGVLLRRLLHCVRRLVHGSGEQRQRSAFAWRSACLLIELLFERMPPMLPYVVEQLPCFLLNLQTIQ
jgi:hypothetical protein